MFLAIIIPAARKSLKILTVVLIAAGISLLFRFLIPAVSGGFAIIISAVIASAAGSLLFPEAKEEEERA